MKATINSKGQITIPKEIRNRLGLVEGSVLEFDEEASFLKAIPQFEEEDIRDLLGSRKELPGSVSYLDETRGKADLLTIVNEK